MMMMLIQAKTLTRKAVIVSLMVRIGCLIGRRMANERLIASIGLQCYLGQPFAGRILVLTTTVAAVHSSSSNGLSLPASSFRLAKVHVVVGVFQLLLQRGNRERGE